MTASLFFRRVLWIIFGVGISLIAAPFHLIALVLTLGIWVHSGEWWWEPSKMYWMVGAWPRATPRS